MITKPKSCIFIFSHHSITKIELYILPVFFEYSDAYPKLLLCMNQLMKTLPPFS